jgi:hypothetical protein
MYVRTGLSSATPNWTNYPEKEYEPRNWSIGVMEDWAIKGGKDFVSLNPSFKYPIILLF